MLIRFVDMNMYTMKIFLKLKRCLNKLLILTLDITVLGGDKETLHLSNKNMIELVNSLREPLILILRIQFCTHLWV